MEGAKLLHDRLRDLLLDHDLHLEDDPDFSLDVAKRDGLKQFLFDFDPTVPENLEVSSPVKEARRTFQAIMERNDPEAFDERQALAAGAAWNRLQRCAPSCTIALPEPEGPFSLISPAWDAGDLLRAKLKPLRTIIDPYFPEAGAGLIYGPPGVGKTFFVDLLALAVSKAGQFLAWQVSQRWPVMLIDGELSQGLIQKRLRLVLGDEDLPGRNWLRVLTMEDILASGGSVIDLALDDHKAHLLKIMEWSRNDPDQRSPKLLILDNLPSLASTLEESDNTAVASINTFISRLRFMGIAVLLVHHSPKAGTGSGPRGASALSGCMDFVMSMDPCEGGFLLEFRKQRHEPVTQPSLKIGMQATPQGIEFKILGPGSNPLRDLLLKLAHLPEVPASLREASEMLGIPKTTLDRQLKDLRQRGFLDGMRINQDGKRYAGLDL